MIFVFVLSLQDFFLDTLHTNLISQDYAESTHTWHKISPIPLLKKGGTGQVYLGETYEKKYRPHLSNTHILILFF